MSFHPRYQIFAHLARFRVLRPRLRKLSTEPPRLSPSATAEATQKQQSRLDRIITRLPRFTQPYVQPLRRAPVTHVTAFLILHEITAVAPLLGLVALFHYTNWLPSWSAEGEWAREGVEKFGKYLKKKGWVCEQDVEEARELEGANRSDDTRLREQWLAKGGSGVRTVIEFATAYAIVKALIVPRIILSAWASPWFARITLIPATNLVKRMFGRGPNKAGPS